MDRFKRLARPFVFGRIDESPMAAPPMGTARLAHSAYAKGCHMQTNWRHEVGASPQARSVPRSPTLLLVDDHELVRYGVKTLYAEVHGVPVRWIEAHSLQDALDLYASEPHIDAVLLDLNLSDCKGLQGLRRFIKVHPDARVAVLSGTQDEFVVRQARALGACGYLTKGAVTAQMHETLAELIWPDERARGPRSAQSTLFPRVSGASIYDRVAELGSRHIEILELVLSGCTNQEISNSMGLSLGTVKNYVSALLLALDVKSRSHLVSLFR
jgi:DNA-binding NarL/FixJ family response regulator